jgi:hypothetical protein
MRGCRMQSLGDRAYGADRAASALCMLGRCLAGHCKSYTSTPCCHASDQLRRLADYPDMYSVCKQSQIRLSKLTVDSVFSNVWEGSLYEFP